MPTHAQRPGSTWRAIVLLAAVSVPPAAAQQAERLTVAGDRVAIYNLVGRVRVDAGTGADVVVEVTRGGRDQAQVHIERGAIDRLPGYATLRVVFPGTDIVYPPLARGSRSEVRVREDGTFGSDDHRDGRRGRRNDDAGRVRISGTGPGLEAWADLRISVPAGRRVNVNVGVGDISVANVDGQLHVDGSSSSVNATGTRGALDVDVGSGSVTVNDARGILSIDTGSGRVEVSTFTGSDLSIDTGSGAVGITGATAATVSVSTGSGDVRLSAIASPNLKVDTGSGEVDLDLTTDVDRVDVETGSGSVVLHLPAAIGAQVDIESGSGGVESDIPLEVTTWGRDHVRGTMGDGKGTIAVETGSGKVRIMKRS